MLTTRSRHAGFHLVVGLAAAVVGLMAPAARALAQGSPVNLVTNGTFDGATIDPWATQVNDCSSGYPCAGGINAAVVDSTVDMGIGDLGDIYYGDRSIYDDQLGESLSAPIVKGHQYSVSFWAMASDIETSSPSFTMPVIVQISQPNSVDFAQEVQVPDYDAATASYGKTFTFTFTAPANDTSPWMGFFVGGQYDEISMQIDSISVYDLTGGTGPAPSSAVLVNQYGYLPSGSKRSTIVSSSSAPLAWSLLDSSSAVVASGMTQVHGLDAQSGDSTHLADFSSFTGSGNGFVLQVGTLQSVPFAIQPDLYKALRRDALRFFYHQHCSASIDQPFAEGAQWARAAGHPDLGMTCQAGGCAYALDVPKGWYDAGDHGKYVVNGGIALWTLFDIYERTQQLGTTLGDLGDGTLDIPLGTNQVPDLLDEARWEMEFILEMQVPAGQPLAGMAHHKVHDDVWTGLPTLPASDFTPRHLHPPSTTATLNLAATAAQCARVFAGVDAAFAARCLTAAETAFAAAQANPAVYAPATDNAGGGSYEDSDASDEFYWAAAELYLTTGGSPYLQLLEASPHFAEVTGFFWQSVAGLGTISLAILPSALPAADLAAVRGAVVDAARSLLTTIDGSGYGSPLTTYNWGSNSAVLNDGITLALAYDLTGDASFLKGATATVDYVLGRNPLDESFVTGYGYYQFHNSHHRFWAHFFDPGFPSPPPGALASGVDQFPADRLFNGVDPLAGCATLKCWEDNANLPSLAEVAINWNAPLAWMAAWLGEIGTNPSTRHPGLTGGAAGTGGASGGTGTGGASGGTGIGGASGGTGTGGASGGTGTGGASGGTGTGGSSGVGTGGSSGVGTGGSSGVGTGGASGGTGTGGASGVGTGGASGVGTGGASGGTGTGGATGAGMGTGGLSGSAGSEGGTGGPSPQPHKGGCAVAGSSPPAESASTTGLALLLALCVARRRRGARAR